MRHVPSRAAVELELKVGRPKGEKLGLRLFDLTDNFYDPDQWVLADILTRSEAPGARGPQLMRSNARPVVRSVAPGGLAELAGVRANDIVMMCNGVADIDLLQMGAMLRDGADVALKVRRKQAKASRPVGASAGPSTIMAATGGGGGLSSDPPPAPIIEAPNGIPLTARAVKSSIQLDKELKDVGRTLEKQTRRLTQTLHVVRGVKIELRKCQASVRTRLETNPSLTMDPRGKEAQAAAEAAVSDVAVAESLVERFGYEPSESMLATELRIEKSKMCRRREVLNKPVVEALTELEETATIGGDVLEKHEEKVQMYLDQLWEVYKVLGGHYSAHHVVASPKADRAKVHRLHDHATHEALEIAAQREDSARHAMNMALKAVQAEKSSLEARKADVQRAMLARTQRQMEFKRMDNQGCTFREWTVDELKLGAD